MSFELIENNIIAYFQSFVEQYNLVARYDNDLRDTPSSGYWYNCKINYEDTKQKEIGTNSYRTIGDFTIEIFNPIKFGSWFILNMIDKTIPYFNQTIINSIIKFQTPKVKNIGRVKDNYQMNIICPFYVDN